MKCPDCGHAFSPTGLAIHRGMKHKQGVRVGDDGLDVEGLTRALHACDCKRTPRATFDLHMTDHRDHAARLLGWVAREYRP